MMRRCNRHSHSIGFVAAQLSKQYFVFQAFHLDPLIYATLISSHSHLHSQHFGVLLTALPASKCCINSCCRLVRKARSSFICSFICDISCCICRIAVHNWRRVGVISSFSKPSHVGVCTKSSFGCCCRLYVDR